MNAERGVNGEKSIVRRVNDGAGWLESDIARCQSQWNTVSMNGPVWADAGGAAEPSCLRGINAKQLFMKLNAGKQGNCIITKHFKFSGL